MKVIILLLAAGLLSLSVYFWWSEAQQAWETPFGDIGTLSSPRAADLNGDRIKDIIIGAGGQEGEPTDTALVALDGKNGRLLWALGARDQLFGTPVLLDINADQTEDVVISGRAGKLMAVDGKTGEKIWDLQEDQQPDFPLYNIFTPALVPDQNGDQLTDLLVAQGGDVSKKPHETNRPAGMLMLLDARQANILTQDSMPDGKETYLSPVVYERDGQTQIIFGTGGETIPGMLFRISLDDFVNYGLTKAQSLAVGKQKGFIAPPVLGDLNGDGYEDIVVNAVEGRLMAIDGVTSALLWEVQRDAMEVYTSPALGHFNEDGIPDVFVNFGKGIWPDLVACRQLAIDGAKGKVLLEDSVSFFSMSSPITLDINEDGTDEALLSVNYRVEKRIGNQLSVSNEVYNKLLAFDVANQQRLKLDLDMPGPNPAVTPLLDDLDGDGLTDLVFAYQTDPYHMGQFNGMKVLRKELDIPAPVAVKGYLHPLSAPLIP